MLDVKTDWQLCELVFHIGTGFDGPVVLQRELPE